MRGGMRLEDALAAHGVDLDRAPEAAARLRDVRAYLELHIEQGPVLEGLGLPVGTVLGTVGVERNRVIFRGQAAHAGSTPMTHRRDSFLAAARFALAVRDAAVRHGGMSTTGGAASQPGVVTAIAGETALLLDQRHLDADALAVLLAESRTLAEEAAASEHCSVEWEPIWRIDPIPFDAELIVAARTACQDVAGSDSRVAVGPAARRRGDGAARADGHDLLVLDQRHQPRQGGGHPDRAPRARDQGVRADRRCRDRPGRGGMTFLSRARRPRP